MKTKQKNQILSLFLMLALLLGMLPLSAFADDADAEGAGDANQSIQAEEEQILEAENDNSASQQAESNDDASSSSQTAALTANDFSFRLDTISNLDEAMAISLASVSQGEVLLAGGVTVDSAQLSALQAASSEGTYPLTFYAGNESVSITVTILSGASLAPATSATNGSVTVKIDEYDDSVGWENGAIKDVVITVDFADTISTDKTVSIKLPEGIKFKEYPVVAKDSDPSNSLQVVDSTVFKDFVTGITSYPEKPSHGNDYGSFNGTLTYTFRESTQTVTFTIKVAVDESVYYGPKTFDEGIVVEASKAGGSIGKVVQEIKATHSVTTGILLYHTNYKKVIVSGANDSFYLSCMYMEYRGASATSSAKKYFKDIELTYYYLPQLEYSSFTYSGNTYGTAPSVQDYPTGNASDATYPTTPCVVMTAEDVITDTNLNCGYWWFNFTAIGASAGTYSANYTQRVKITAYDDTVIDTDYSNSKNAGQSVTRSVTETLTVVDNATTALALSTENRTYAAEVSDDYQVSVPIWITSDATGVKENQWFEASIPAEFQATQVVIPVNSTELATNARLYYETSNDTTGYGRWITGNTLKLYAYNSSFVGITQKSLGLSSNEYITYVRAYVGDYAAGYATGTGSATYAGPGDVGNIVGSLSGTTSATIAMRMYSCDLANDSDGLTVTPGTETTASATVSYTGGKGNVAAGLGSTASTIVAGEDKSFTFTLIPSYYYYQNTLGIYEPNFYFRDIPGITITKIEAMDTLQGSYTDYTSYIDKYTTSQGVDVNKVQLDGLKCGSYFDVGGLPTRSTITVRVTLHADITASGNYNWMDYIFWDVDGVFTYSTTFNRGAVVSDTYDVNNDGHTSDKVWRVPNTAFSITAAKGLVVDTFIVPDGGSRQPAYDSTDESTVESTAIRFTPNVDATYTVDMYNNMDVPVTELALYIPIPKAGNDFGANFQDAAFTWNMALQAAPTITGTNTSKYIVTYSVDASSDSNYTSAPYYTAAELSSNVIAFEDVTMVKITLDTGEEIAAYETAQLTFDYKVDEDGITNPDRLGKINTFRPYYYIDSSDTAGWLQGTLVGAKLVNGVISGYVFLDKNGDGVYTAGTDTLSTDTTNTVVLYVLDTDSNQYISTGKTATLDANGKYEFTGLPNGNYKVDFRAFRTSAAYYFTTQQQLNVSNGSHVIQLDTNNDAGTRSGIDPTVTTSQSLNAGILDYNPATDLKVTVNPATANVTVANNLGTGAQTASGTVTVSSSIYGSTAVLPSNNAVSVTYSNSNVATVSVGSFSTSNGSTTASYTATGRTAGSTTATVKVTDIFGNTATADITVNVSKAANQYTVAYDGNSPTSGTMTNQSITYGTSYSLTANAYVKTGYTFQGWDTSSAGTTVVYSNSATMTGNEFTSNTTLYAVWQVDTYTITFDGNSQTSGTMSNQSFTYGAGYSLTANAYVKIGYTFQGWDTSNAGATVVHSDSAAMTGTEFAANTTLYAVWKENTVTVAFDTQGGSAAPSSFTSGADTALGTNLTSITDPTKAGYIFDGWFTAATGGTQASSTSTPIGLDSTLANNGALTLYAHWTIDSNVTGTVDIEYYFDGTYDANYDASLNGQWVSSVTTTDVQLATVPTGYIYDSTSVTLPDTYGNLDGKTISVHYIPDTTVTGTVNIQYYFAGNYNSNYDASLTGQWLSSVTITDVQLATVPTGYIYSSTSVTLPDTYGNLDDTTIIVYYVTSGGGGGGGGSTTYTVTYDANGGTGSYKNSGLSYGTTYTIVSQSDTGITYDGYSFMGWNTKADGSGTSYKAADTLKISSNVTLYAQWEELEVIQTDDNVPLVEWNEEHVPYLFGYADGTVRADNSITRAEAAIIFYRLLVSQDTASGGQFSDVSNDAWYAQAVNYLSSLGIINGYTDGTFRPNATITRAEFATMAAGFDNLSYTDNNVFSDVAENHWATSYINSAYAKGWINGYTDGTFRPEHGITRAEVVSIVNAMRDRAIDEDALAQVESPYSDISSSHWAYADIIEASVEHEYGRDDNGKEIWQS